MLNYQYFDLGSECPINMVPIFYIYGVVVAIGITKVVVDSTSPYHGYLYQFPWQST